MAIRNEEIISIICIELRIEVDISGSKRSRWDVEISITFRELCWLNTYRIYKYNKEKRIRYKEEDNGECSINIWFELDKKKE